MLLNKDYSKIYVIFISVLHDFRIKNNKMNFYLFVILILLDLII